MVNYEKNSFLAGVAVGRQLRGWSVAEAGGAVFSFPLLAETAAPPLALSAALTAGPAASLDVVTMEVT